MYEKMKRPYFGANLKNDKNFIWKLLWGKIPIVIFIFIFVNLWYIICMKKKESGHCPII